MHAPTHTRMHAHVHSRARGGRGGSEEVLWASKEGGEGERPSPPSLTLSSSFTDPHTQTITLIPQTARTILARCPPTACFWHARTQASFPSLPPWLPPSCPSSTPKSCSTTHTLLSPIPRPHIKRTPCCDVEDFRAHANKKVVWGWRPGLIE